MAKKKEQIKYRSGYKYQLAETYSCYVSIPVEEDIISEFINLKKISSKRSKLVIKSGYAWDGPSGPTFDTANSMRGSLIHDALYQLIRQEFLSQETREIADNIFHSILLEDGMDKYRANRWYIGVRHFAEFAADPKNMKEVHLAP